MQPMDLDATLTDAMAAHSKWKLRLSTAIKLHKFDTDVETVRRPDCCAFGQWIENEQDQEIIDSLPYKVVKRLHREFHQCAGSVVEKATSGQEKTAERLMQQDYKPRSDKLVTALKLWRSELRQAYGLSGR